MPFFGSIHAAHDGSRPTCHWPINLKYECGGCAFPWQHYLPRFYGCNLSRTNAFSTPRRPENDDFFVFATAKILAFFETCNFSPQFIFVAMANVPPKVL